jgi:O-antigen/teichoic acid export membrane protein
VRPGTLAEEARQDILDTPAAGPRLIRGGALRISAYAVGSLLSVLSAALLTRHLGAADFGRYAAVFSLITIVTGLTDAGTLNIGVREHALRRGAEREAMLRQLLGLRLALTVAGIAAALAFAWLAGWDDAMVAGTLLAGAGLAVLVVQGTLAIPLQSALQLGWVSGLDLLRQVLTVAGIVALVVAGAGIAPLLGVPIPVAAVLLVVTGLLVRSRATARPAFAAERWRELFAVALPYAAATAVGILYAHVTVLLMSVVSSEAETGWFSTGFRIYFVLATIPGLLVTTAFPLLARAARDDRDRLRYAVQRLLDVNLVGGAAFALLTALGAGALVEAVAGPEFAPAVDALRLQAIALFGTFVIAVGGFALLALGRYRALLGANAVTLAISVGLTLALAPGSGATGAAVAMAVGDLALAALYFLALRQEVSVSFALLPRVALATAAGGGVALLTGLPAVPAALVGGTVLAVVLVALRAVPPEVGELVRRRA